MKTLKSILIQVVFLLLLSQLTYSQEVEVNLGGNTTSDAFVVKDSSGNSLLRVDGGRSFGINTEQPNGIEIRGKSTLDNGQGDPIIIAGGNRSGYNDDGALITVNGGGYNVGGSISIMSGGGNNSGNIDIETVHPRYDSGDINIHTGRGDIAGNINISTGDANVEGGSINLSTGYSNSGNSITLTTPYTESESPISLLAHGKIEIKTGSTDYNHGIMIETGPSIYGTNNIELTVGDDGVEGQSRGIILRPNAGFVEIIGSGTYTGSWTQASDERYKNNIKPLSDLLNKVKLLEPVEYDWNKEDYPDKNFSDRKQIGLIAQDVEQIFPGIVSTDRDGYKSIDYSKLSVLLLQAMKEQQSKIDKQADEISDMKSDIEKLKSMIMKDSNKLTSN